MGSFLSAPITDKNTSEVPETNGLRAAVSEMQGWRTEMEDADTMVLSVPGLPDHSLFAVFDGHGGKQAAIYAAANVQATLKRQSEFEAYVAGGAKDVELLRAAFSKAFFALDAALRECPEVQEDHSGCTAVAAMVTPTHIVCSNAGDSRSILVSAGGAVPMSDDHKPNNEEERDRIVAAGGHVSMGRVDGDLAVSRALGDFQYKDASMPPEKCKVTAHPDVLAHPRNAAQDEILVLACDGIWDVMSNDDAALFLLSLFREAGESQIGLVCEELIDHCLNLGSRDNMSAVIVAMPPAFTGANSAGGGVMSRRRARDAAEAEVAALREAAGGARPEA